MKPKMLFSLLLMMVLCTTTLFTAKVNAQDRQQLVGVWLGKLEINPEVQMAVAFEIKADGTALMHSLDQKAYDKKVDELELEGQDLKMLINTINGTYKGRLVGSDTISGGLNQGGGEALWPLHLAKVERLPDTRPRRPQEPVGELPYRVEEVFVENESAGATLAGTLTLPEAPGPHPAVILVPGSGPSDRDQTIFGHKVFLVWADMLTRAGYAVLRMDDRGVAASTGDYNTATLEDLADDVVRGVDWLKERREIDSSSIGLVGHSLGAEIATIAAPRSSDLSFLVLMAGAGEPTTKTIIAQTEKIYGQAGASKEAISLNTEILQAVFPILENVEDKDEARRSLDAALDKFNPKLAKLDPEDLKKVELGHPIDPSPFYKMLTPGSRSEILNDPAVHLQKITIPVLAMTGTKDVQVLPHNLELIEQEIKSGGNQQVTVKSWKDKNHLFQTATSGSIAEYGQIEETIAPEVIAYLVEWMDGLGRR